MKKIVVGVIGAGRIGKLHIDNMRNMANVEVKLVSDVFADQLKDWAAEKGIAITANYQDIMNDPEINAVFICSPTDTHVDMIKAAAAAKKNIFCEKPISFSEEETMSAYQAVKDAGVKMQVGFNRRFDRNFSRAHDLVQENKIGKIHVVKITSRDPEPPSLDYVAHSGGLFMDMAIHDFDMARFITSSEVSEVFVQGAALVNPKIAELGDIDTAIIMMKFENGAIGVIDNSRQAVYGYDQRLEVFGNEGAISVENENESTVTLSSKDNVTSDQPLHFFLERYNQAYVEEVSEFITAIQEDKDISCRFEDGIMAQHIAQACKKSLETGETVKVAGI